MIVLPAWLQTRLEAIDLSKEECPGNVKPNPKDAEDLGEMSEGCRFLFVLSRNLFREVDKLSKEVVSATKSLTVAQLEEPEPPTDLVEKIHDLESLMMLSDLARDIFWTSVKSEFPVKDDKDLYLGNDWRVLATEKPKRSRVSIISLGVLGGIGGIHL